MAEPELIFYVVGKYPTAANEYVLHEQGCMDLPGMLMRHPIGLFETKEAALVRANELFPGCTICKNCRLEVIEQPLHYTFGKKCAIPKKRI